MKLVFSTTQGLVGALEERAKAGIDAALRDLRDYAVRISPEDTKRFVESHEIHEAHKVGTSVVGSLVNETPYAIYLEYGVLGKQYNYHKGPKKAKKRRLIYSGIGVRVYRRTLDANQQSIQATIKRALYGQ